MWSLSIIDFIKFSLFSFQCFFFFRSKKAVALLQQKRKISLLASIIMRGRTGCLSCFQVDISVSVLLKSTNWSTTASAVVELCVNRRARDRATSAGAWYGRFSSLGLINWGVLFLALILILLFNIWLDLVWPVFKKTLNVFAVCFFLIFYFERAKENPLDPFLRRKNPNSKGPEYRKTVYPEAKENNLSLQTLSDCSVLGVH